MPRRHLKFVSWSLVAALGAGASGCEDGSYRDMGGDISVLTKREDALVAVAADRLVAFKRRALPQIETALHTASPAGKVHLLTVLERIGDAEAIPVLRHFALYDPNPEVRGLCERVLKQWAEGSAGGEPDDQPTRAHLASAALSHIASKRAAGEGPVVVGVL